MKGMCNNNNLLVAVTSVLLLLSLQIQSVTCIDLIKARANVAVLNELRTVFIDEFIPGLQEFVNQQDLVERNDQVFFDNFLGKLSGFVEVRGLQLNTNTTNVEIKGYRFSGADVIQVGFIDLFAGLSDINLGLLYDPPSILTPVACGVDLGGSSLSIQDLRLQLRIDLDDGEISFGPRRVSLGGVDVNLDTAFRFDLCQLTVAPVAQILAFFTDSIANFVAPFLVVASETFVEQFNSAVNVDITQDIDITENGVLQISPIVSTLEIDRTNSYIDVAGGTSTFAYLLGPEWRANNSFIPSYDRDRTLPTPDDERLININVGIDGLNELIQSAWYIGWSSFVTAEPISDSRFCSILTSDTDPCPFPPFQLTSGFEVWLLRPLFLLEGFFRSFQYEVIVEPPTLQVDRSDAISVEATAKAFLGGDRFLFGWKDLAQINARVVASAAFPTYDSDAGNLEGLGLAGVRISDFSVNLLGIGRLLFILTWGVTFVTRTVINTVVSLFLPLINDNIFAAVSNFPLSIPEFPVTELGFNISLGIVDVELRGNQKTSDTTAYLQLGANLAVDIINLDGTTSRRQLEQDSSDDDTTNEKYKFQTQIYDWAKKYIINNHSLTEDIIILYATTYRNSTTGKHENQVLRRVINNSNNNISSSSDNKIIEILNDDEIEWVPFS